MTDTDRKKPSPLRFGVGVLAIIAMVLGLFFFLPWLMRGKENAIEIGTLLLWMLGFGVVLAIPAVLINLALDQKG
ncbi:MAG: hypothetical protein ABR501_05155 [Pyrinomonadaceae bacterium]